MGTRTRQLARKVSNTNVANQSKEIAGEMFNQIVKLNINSRKKKMIGYLPNEHVKRS